ncbi:MAG TPA: amidohydrolase family protein [Stellaceae bacterium]|nr:amidohydrolase family protein [Stellaceae bacterium]
MAHKVDVHTHCTIPGREDPFGVADLMRGQLVGGNMVTNFRGLPAVGYREMLDFDLQQEVSHRAGITRRLMSSPFMAEAVTPYTSKPAIDVIKYGNDEVARIVDKSPADTWGMGTVNPLDASHIKEAERCMGPLKFKGLLICSSWHGKFIDTEDTWPFWEYAEAQQVPIFIHPVRVPIGHERQMDQYKLDELVGRPFDTAMALARMILSGLFDRHPRLKIVVAHMGGGLLPVMGRLDFGWRLGCDGMPDAAKIKCKDLPSSYLAKHLAVDTMGVWAPHVREAVEVFGPDRVMLGTDYGPVPIDPKEHVDIVETLAISDADKEKIFWRNADSFFGLGLAA